MANLGVFASKLVLSVLIGAAYAAAAVAAPTTIQSCSGSDETGAISIAFKTALIIDSVQSTDIKFTYAGIKNHAAFAIHRDGAATVLPAVVSPGKKIIELNDNGDRVFAIIRFDGAMDHGMIYFGDFENEPTDPHAGISFDSSLKITCIVR